MRIVIKIGSSSLTTNEEIDLNKFENLTNQIIELHKEHEIIVVSSGAIASAKSIFKTEKMTLSLKQAAASVGQLKLMNTYNDFFKKSNIIIGQILLSRDDIASRIRNLNARNNLNELLKLKIIPIINENDAVTVDEIKVGDNDNLAALVAILIDADLLILVSDVNGIYDKNPHLYRSARLIKEIKEIDETLKSYAGISDSSVSVGGMITKLEAADKVISAGINMVIVNSKEKNILKNVIDNTFVGSKFIGRDRQLVTRDKWLLFSANIKGCIIIDVGAKDALINKKSSLLPVGIIEIKNSFQATDVVEIICENEVIGVGITNYSSTDLNLIKGLKNFEEEYLFKTAIHRDYLVLK